MQVRANRNKFKENNKYLIWQKKSSENTERSEPQAASIVTYTEEEAERGIQKRHGSHKHQDKFCDRLRRFPCWYEGKHHKELELNKITKQEVPPAVKTFHFRNSTDKQRKQM